MNFTLANRIAPDGTPRFAASHLGLFCLPMSHKKDARFIWVNMNICSMYRNCVSDLATRIVFNIVRIPELKGSLFQCLTWQMIFPVFYQFLNSSFPGELRSWVLSVACFFVSEFR